MKTAIAISAGLVLLSSGAAVAGHGKAGLWNVSTTMDMASMKMPPEVMAQMKKMGVAMPANQTFASQICMTQAEVDTDKPPHMDGRNGGCTTRPISTSGSSMSAEMVCNGEMKGKGKMQISWNGAEHYSGTYSFQGVINGRPMDTRTTFKGDWAKADCGAVKPFAGR